MKKLNILIPTDFSDVSFLGIQMSQMISTRLSLNVHLLNVIEVNDTDSDFLEGFQQDNLRKQESLALEKFEALKELDISFESHVRVGKLTDQISSAGKELGIDLVIMGTKGSHGFMELISGSEAQHLTRVLEIPVLSIRPGSQIAAPREILFVADFEMLSEELRIGTVKTIAEAFGSTIHLLRILTKEDGNSPVQVESQMKAFAEKHQLEKYETHLFHDHKVADGVRNFNREADMDLVCIGTHGRKGISQLLFGSIAERLVNHCIKPLLTFQLKPHA